MTALASDVPAIATRDEWLTARLELLRKEKEHTRMRDALNEERRRLPMVKVEKDYRFQTAQGERRLVDLFEGRQQLIVHHFMWIDRAGEGCPGCSMLMDTVGNLVHLNAANTTLAFVSRAPIEQLEAFRARMGWTTPIVSSAGTDFNFDFHVTLDPTRGATTYNFRDVRELGGPIASYSGDLPGESVFLRRGGDVYHTYSTYARGTEPSSNIFGFLDYTPLGRQDGRDAQPWARLHDRYDA